MNEAPGRLHLENAVGQAKARNARRSAEMLQQGAVDARDGAARLIAGHPFAAVAGGVAVGVLIGALLSRRKWSQGAGALGALLSQAALDYGHQALKMARQAHHANEDIIVEAAETAHN